MIARNILKKGTRAIATPAWLVKRELNLLQCRIMGNQQCQACGFKGRFNKGRMLWPELIEEWELSPEWVN
jgi:hypothetical protein